MIVIGVAGGTGSGKSTLCRRLLSDVGAERALLLRHDDYYHDLAHLPDDRRVQTNFDHPAALDSGLLVDHLHQLSRGQSIDVPQYDFASHTRRAESRRVEPKPLILLDGVFILAEPELRQRCRLKIFVQAHAKIRFQRRLRRDVAQRARTPESVIRQWKQTVWPMHQQHVEPSKQHADVILPMDDWNEAAVQLVLGYLSAWQ